MKKIAVSIGHHPERPGYSTDKTSEYQEMCVVAGYLVQALQKHGYMAFLIGSRPLDQKVAQVNNISGKADCAIELHLNAAGGVGFETLYMPGSKKGKSLAQSVNGSMGEYLGSRNRGVKAGYYQMNPNNEPDYFLRATNCPAIITEAYFLDNNEECERYVGNTLFYLHLADSIAGGVIKFLG